jgi:hypothetical protein
VLVTGAVSTPFLMGWRRPFLVLPADLMGRVGAAGIGHVVAHELAHARHRDVLVNWVSLVLGAVHWFNPCAWWVQRRLWAAREATRDFEVVGRPGGPSPHAYGETLLRLAAAPARVPTTLAGAVTDSAVLRWRIHMLTIDDARRRSRWFGLALLLAFSGVTLLGAAREPGAASAPVPDDAQPRQGIRVEREGPPPPWMSELEKRLEMEVDADFETVPLEDVLALVRRAGKINVVLSGEAEDRGNEEVRLSPGRRSLRSLLEAACGQLSLGYALVAEAVLVGDPGRVRVLERRIYDVGPLLAGHRDDPDRIEHLAELVRDLMGEAWDHDGVSMRRWNGLLLVTQTAQQHARLHRILERILHPETPDPVERTPEMVRLEEALQKKGSVAYDETPFAAVRSDLHSRFGITIRPNEALLEDDRPVTLVLDDLRASEIVAWIARQLGCVFVPDRGTLVPSEAPVLDTRYYDVSGLVGTDDDQQALLELIREIVEPDTWDEHPMAMIRFWDRLMIIVQTDRTHEQIVAFLAALRRARS